MILSLFLQRTRMNLFTSIWNDRNLWSSCEDLVRWGMATKIRVTLHDCAISVSIKFHKRKNCHWHVIVCFCLISVLIHFAYFCFIIIIVSKFQYSWYMFLNLNLRKNCTVKRKIYTEKMSWSFLLLVNRHIFISGTLSADEWEAAYLYMSFVLRKVSNNVIVLAISCW